MQIKAIKNTLDKRVKRRNSTNRVRRKPR